MRSLFQSMIDEIQICKCLHKITCKKNIVKYSQKVQGIGQQGIKQLSVMLKFLQNRDGQIMKKSPKKYKPEMLYGISYEAPSQFQTPHTIIKADSYINPYVRFQQRRKLKIPTQKTKNVDPQWKYKINLNMVQEQKIVSSVPDLISYNHISSRYTHAYHDQLNKSPRRFMMTKGEFTDFIEKNNHYKSIGPLHGIQRTNERILNTKQSVWLNSTKSRHGSTFLNSSFNSSMKRSSSSISKNSELITQKTRIRFNRQNFNNRLRIALQQRKKINSNSIKFELPKIGSEIVSIHRDQVGVFGRDDRQQDETVKELDYLDTFTERLNRKFK